MPPFLMFTVMEKISKQKIIIVGRQNAAFLLLTNFTRPVLQNSMQDGARQPMVELWHNGLKRNQT